MGKVPSLKFQQSCSIIVIVFSINFWGALPASTSATEVKSAASAPIFVLRKTNNGYAKLIASTGVGWRNLREFEYREGYQTGPMIPVQTIWYNCDSGNYFVIKKPEVVDGDIYVLDGRSPNGQREVGSTEFIDQNTIEYLSAFREAEDRKFVHFVYPNNMKQKLSKFFLSACHSKTVLPNDMPPVVITGEKHAVFIVPRDFSINRSVRVFWTREFGTHDSNRKIAPGSPTEAQFKKHSDDWSKNQLTQGETITILDKTPIVASRVEVDCASRTFRFKMLIEYSFDGSVKNSVGGSESSKSKDESIAPDTVAEGLADFACKIN